MNHFFKSQIGGEEEEEARKIIISPQERETNMKRVKLMLSSVLGGGFGCVEF